VSDEFAYVGQERDPDSANQDFGGEGSSCPDGRSSNGSAWELSESGILAGWPADRYNKQFRSGISTRGQRRAGVPLEHARTASFAAEMVARGSLGRVKLGQAPRVGPAPAASRFERTPDSAHRRNVVAPACALVTRRRLDCGAAWKPTGMSLVPAVGGPPEVSGKLEYEPLAVWSRDGDHLYVIRSSETGREDRPDWHGARELSAAHASFPWPFVHQWSAAYTGHVPLLRGRALSQPSTRHRRHMDHGRIRRHSLCGADVWPGPEPRAPGDKPD